MYTFILIMPDHAVPDDTGELLKDLGPVERAKAVDRCIVKAAKGMQDGWIAIQRAPKVAEDYEPEELARVRLAVPNPVFFVVEGRDANTAFANEFVMRLDDRRMAWIDNDNGLFEPVTRVKELINSGVDWQDL